MDGNDSVDSDNSSNDAIDEDGNDDSDMTEYDTDDEVHSEPVPANLKPVPGQHVHPSQPLLFDVDVEEDAQPSSVPLCLVLNCRSASNKINNLREMLRSICPSLTILSETWERERQRLNVILNINQFKIISYYRKTNLLEVGPPLFMIKISSE